MRLVQAHQQTMKAGDVISYMDMCLSVGVNLQRGMNYRVRSGSSVILMSLRRGAPYADRIENEGKVLIYEGHDIARTTSSLDPKSIDQPERNPNGSLTQNGLFAEAVRKYKSKTSSPELVNVYEKIRAGIWTYNGLFYLVDYWIEESGTRKVFKFRLELAQGVDHKSAAVSISSEDDRLIPSYIKLEVWKRDKGRCTKCGSNTHLHFDHIIPYSKGGSSKDAKNIQILCGRHNLEKGDEIE